MSANGANWHLSRAALLWLLLAQLMVVGPHLPHLPFWLILLWGVSLVWRVQIYRARWALPHRAVKTLLVALGFGGIYLTYGSFVGLEPMISLGIIGFLLKITEMRSYRDALVVVFLGFFLSASQLIFSQFFYDMALALVAFLTLIATLNTLSPTQYPLPMKQGLTSAGILMAQALPLMVVLFVVMPRLPALWSIPSPEGSAKTGMSDTMSPGDVSNLSRSGAPAFRVTFDGVIPPKEALYWRGLVLDQFDGRTWSADPRVVEGRDAVRWYGQPPKYWEQRAQAQGDSLDYQVMLEPTGQRWLYALATPVARTLDTGLSRHFALVSKKPITSRTAYSLSLIHI